MAVPPPLRRALVAGAGVMGSQIAALLASVGVEVDLLDVPVPEGDRDALAKGALARLRTLRPTPYLHPSALERIHPGNLEDHLDRLAQADWVLEAVTEDLEIKRALWDRLATSARADAVLSTNTSGLAVSEILPPSHPARNRFLATHFFNPPRYLHLLELVPTEQTDPQVVDVVRLWAERNLGKGVVVAKDTPNFIANRVGAYALHVVLQVMEEMGLDVATVDALTGPVVGHPRSATFRTLDLVGLDTHAKVIENLRQRLSDPQELSVFQVPGYFREMMARGWLGEKTGQGFYRREGQGPNRRILVLDLATFAYGPPAPRDLPSLRSAQAMRDLGERLRLLAFASDDAGHFTWKVLSRVLTYAVDRAQEIAGGHFEAIDRAMRWGYQWEKGPCEMWELIGLEQVARRLEAEGRPVPTAVEEALRRGDSRLYTPDPLPSRLWSLPPAPALLAYQPVVEKGDSATLVDLGQEVWALVLHPDHDAIGPDLLRAIHRASRRVEREARGLVLVSQKADRFLVGAHLGLLLAYAQAGDFASVEESVRAFQELNLQLRRLSRPVVAVPSGLALGGGAELVLHAHHVVTGPELYIGLVETGAGLVPAGGGTKEVLRRTLALLPQDLPWSPAQGGSAAAGVGATLYVDPAPWVARVFQMVALAKVSASAREAREMGLLSPTDVEVLNPDSLVHVAREEVLRLDRQGFVPPPSRPIPAPGREVEALLEVAVDGMVRSRMASAHDAKIARALAHVLTGGGVPQGTPLPEERYLDLEREAFLSLLGEPLTQQRMEHLLRTGRPLRN